VRSSDSPSLRKASLVVGRGVLDRADDREDPCDAEGVADAGDPASLALVRLDERNTSLSARRPRA